MFTNNLSMILLSTGTFCGSQPSFRCMKYWIICSKQRTIILDKNRVYGCDFLMVGIHVIIFPHRFVKWIVIVRHTWRHLSSETVNSALLYIASLEWEELVKCYFRKYFSTIRVKSTKVNSLWYACVKSTNSQKQREIIIYSSDRKWEERARPK